MKFTKGFKIVVAIVLAAIAYYALTYFGLAPSARVKEATVPKKFDLPSEAPATAERPANLVPVSLPSAKPSSTVRGTAVRANIWAWNAQMGLIFANGGPVTTSGSLMEKHGVRLQITRQDDTEKSKPEQIKFAQLIAKGDADPSEGIHFVVIMGDGAAQYLAAINKELSRIGRDYRAEIVGAVGYSRGEDGFWGPQEWKDNPGSMKGGVVAGVLRDGDWNIAQYYASQNGVRNNPDEHTWDADALNWVAADDYLKAADLYITGYCEDRDVVSAGKKTGQKKNVCIQGAVTWTPGDVNIAKKKGGLTRILSTRENIYQMPAVMIGIHKWDTDHHKQVEEMLAAAFEGADQVKYFDQALQSAGRASFALYKEESPEYWIRYYKGVEERDKSGRTVPLGGSTVANLSDNLVLFGLAPGSGGVNNSLFKATYEGFGNIAQEQYPKLITSFPSTSEAVDISYVNALSKRMTVTVAEVQEFGEAGPIAKENIVAQRNWNIQFETGKATITPAGEKTLKDLYNQLIVAGALSVEVQGHTDDVGSVESNQRLSEQRAFAVKQKLQEMAPALFPENRISLQAFGQTRPLVPNTGEENRSKNRRVAIVLGTK